jgi:hypothetical protein
MDTTPNLAGPTHHRDRNRPRPLAWLIIAAVVGIVGITPLLPPTVAVAATDMPLPLQGASLIETATVWSVRNYRAGNGADYCTITIAVSSSKPHIRYLTWVYGTSCTAYPQGAAITLVYDVTYDGRGRVATKQLRTWY